MPTAVLFVHYRMNLYIEDSYQNDIYISSIKVFTQNDHIPSR